MKYFGKLSYFCIVLLATGALESFAAPGERGFKLFGRGNSNRSQEEMARAAERVERLRPLPMEAGEGGEGMLLAAVSPSALGGAPQANPGFVAPLPIPESGIGTLPQPPPSLPLPPPPPPPPPRGVEPAIGQDGVEAESGRGISRSRKESASDELRRRAETMAGWGLDYKFGGADPSEGGLDCSGTMRYLFRQMGYSDMPRTSYQQYEWIQQRGRLKKIGFFHNMKRAARKFEPGDLLFTGGTYDSGHKVSHVMMYLGQGRSGKHYVFGASGKKVKGLNGAGVDIFEFDPSRTKLVGYGRLPGLKG